MGWKMGGRFKRENTYVHLWLIHVDIWQKPTQNYKAIILQLQKEKTHMMPSSVASPIFSWSRATLTHGSELHLVFNVLTGSSTVRFSGRTEGPSLEGY